MENFENLSFADSIVMQCFVVHVETCFSFVEAWQWFICILPAKKNPYRLHIAQSCPVFKECLECSVFS